MRAAAEPPSGREWLHEMLLDGEHVRARVEHGHVELRDADGRDRTRELPEVARALSALETDAVVDGEVIEAASPSRRVFVATDLLAKGGESVARAKLERRKEMLRAIVDALADPRVRFNEHVVGDPRALVEAACANGLSGIVSKRRDSRGHADVRITRCRPPARGDGALVVAGVPISSAERVIFPELGIRKIDVARYYESIADAMLPHVRGRPLTLVRCPKSVGRLAAHGRLAESCVYMRHAKVWGPEPLRRITIREKTKVGEYLICDTKPALVALAQMDVIEVHTWNSTAEHLEKPNRVVFDLDPGPGVAYERIARAARVVRERLARFDLDAWVKSTGGKGLHVVVPLTPTAGWDECVAFARGVAGAIAKDAPDEYTVRVEKSFRAGKILLDYLRNVRGNTSVAAYSTRARPGAAISVPLRWNEIDTTAPDAFSITTIGARLARMRTDPWRDYWRARQSIRASMLRDLAHG